MAKYMLADDPDASQKAADAAAWFGDAKTLLSHGRPVRRDEARERGVIVGNLEEDDDFQDAILSVHHAVMHTLASTPSAKIIENEAGRAYILSQQPFQSLLVPVEAPQEQGQGQQGPKKPPPPPKKRRKRR